MPDDPAPPPPPGTAEPGGSPRLSHALGLLVAVRMAVNTGHRFVYPFLPAIARGIGIPLEQAGLLVSARNLAGLATPIVVTTAGRGERRRRLLVAGLVLFAAGAAAAAWFGVFAGVLVGFVAMGVAKPVFDVAAQSFLADRSPYERRARILATLELTWAGSLLIGAPAAGWLIDRYTWEAPFWVVSGLAVASILAIRWLLGDDADDDLRPAAAPLRLRPGSWGLLVTMAATSFSAESTFVVFGAWMEVDFGLTLLALGAASTVIALAELTGSSSVLAFADRMGKRRTVAVGIGLGTLGWAAMLVAGELAVALGAFAVGLLGFELTIVAAIPLASEIHPRARARYLALLVVAVGVGRTVGAAIGPPLFSALGITGPALVAVAGNVLGLAVLLVTVHERSAGSGV
jgi:MFS transporter, DHA1 family, inner membrane transport protein